MLTLASLFDGAGTAPQAAKLVGIKPLWSSEIEAYPLKVTAARLPEVEQMGDITKINGAEVPPVDIIVGGSPCQDLSVAGAQKGLAEGTRSNLFYEMIRIIKEMREATNGKKPRFVLWENVPGAFSSQKGYDFYEVIKEYCRIAEPEIDVPEPTKRSTGGLAWQPAGSVVGDGWSLCWRVFDSQFWGVPQRRKRIYIILDLGSERAAEILFERKGLRGNPPQKQEKGQAAAGDTGKSVAEADIRADSYGCDTINFSSPILRVKTFDGRGFGDGDVVNNITGDHENRITDYTGLVCEPVFCLQGNCIDRADTARCNGRGWTENKAYTINSVDRHAVTYAVSVRCGCEGGGKGALIQTDVSGTLGTHNDQAIFTESSFGAYRDGFGTLREHSGTCGGGSENIVVEKQAVNYDGTGIAQTLDASYYKGTGARNGKEREIVAVRDDIDYLVRRLTPTECARLQGFPDWWEDGVRTSDSASYKMWGNGMTLPVVQWILGQIAKEGESDDQA